MRVEYICNWLEQVEGNKDAHRSGDSLDHNLDRQKHNAFIPHHHLDPMLVDRTIFQRRFKRDYFAPGSLDVANHMSHKTTQQRLIDLGQSVVFEPSLDLSTEALFQNQIAHI